MRGRLIGLFACLFVLALSLSAGSAETDRGEHVRRVCQLIKREAEKNGLPAAFFARLVWTESRFDPGAVSPVGAEGIAQFMPGTAKLRGLADSFEMEAALAASAAYLAEMRERYGNLGRAAIGYNAGEERLRQWIGGNPWLPLETENYVLKVLQEPPERFADAIYSSRISPLDAKLSFLEGCKRLPVIRTRAPAIARPTKPWLVQLAGSFRRGAVERQLEQLRRRHAMLAEHDRIITRLRRPGARARIYAAGIGADSREEANRLCAAFRREGGSCVVQRIR
ncbi:lytic transglycosylase domain-containing protein [Notoacmeibacter sp. MSK16QG-6]|uniref:lytic transglycosylase domain-containing protein n=1 Tax=Notoacmeibacter sp. MSK16QG-6 TaxID=2957982 RepID=UPI00209EF320|nr:lytic transglycosylase domain-containing protein [Notoacmeibacter sp. MSK16QG-6]MCP1200198.1 lytic transglycosylase domain-containing protein [Notoacmeibacter sp. MSK16QG-6]